MAIRFVCLANSFKLHGRCVAGVILDRKNKPLMENGRPKWVRPISSSEHGEINTDLVSHIQLLDIVEIDGVNHLATGHQSENVLFDENSIVVNDVYPNDRLNLISENEQPLIFGNSKKAVHEKYIGQLHYSLMLICIDEFEVTKKASDKMQVRLTFVYNGSSYNLPITDPHFIQNYENDPECLSDVNELFLALSLGLEFNEFYHKLVAGLMY